MKTKLSVLQEMNNNPKGKPIIASKLYREKFSNVMSETAFSQIISRLCRAGVIARISKGIYAIPRKTRFGIITLSEREIVNTFISDNKGILVGYDLYNYLGITTQVAKHMIIYSSAVEERLKQIGRVTIKKYVLEYSVEIKNVISMMEIFYHFRDIQDLDMNAMMNCLEKLSKYYKDEAFEKVQKEINYPKWTIAFMKEVLDFYFVPNNLGKYLSALTKYRIPKIRELLNKK